MLRALAWLLVLANALAWAYGQGHLDRWLPAPSSPREPERLTRQIEPQRLRLVSEVPAAEGVAAVPASGDNRN
jgi:hypothetical protein